MIEKIGNIKYDDFEYSINALKGLYDLKTALDNSGIETINCEEISKVEYAVIELLNLGMELPKEHKDDVSIFCYEYNFGRNIDGDWNYNGKDIKTVNDLWNWFAFVKGIIDDNNKDKPLIIIPNEEDLKLINSLPVPKCSADTIYCIKIKAADNTVDREGDLLTYYSLQQSAELLKRKKGFVTYSESNLFEGDSNRCDISTYVYRTELKRVEGNKINEIGEPVYELYIYTFIRKNGDITQQMYESASKVYGSLSFSVVDRFKFTAINNNTKDIRVLNNITDMYEWAAYIEK